MPGVRSRRCVVTSARGRPSSNHPSAEIGPSGLGAHRPAVITMQTLRHRQRPAMNDFVRHDSRIAADRTAAGESKSTSRTRPADSHERIGFNSFRRPSRPGPLLLYDRRGREHLLHPSAFGDRSLAQSRPISFTRKPVALSTPRATHGWRRGIWLLICSTHFYSLRDTTRFTSTVIQLHAHAPRQRCTDATCRRECRRRLPRLPWLRRPARPATPGADEWGAKPPDDSHDEGPP